MTLLVSAQLTLGYFYMIIHILLIAHFLSPYLRFVGCFTYTISTPKWLDDMLAT